MQVAMRVCVEGRGGAPYSTQCSAGEVRLQSCAQTQGQRLLPRRPQPPGGGGTRRRGDGSRRADDGQHVGLLSSCPRDALLVAFDDAALLGPQLRSRQLDPFVVMHQLLRVPRTSACGLPDMGKGVCAHGGCPSQARRAAGPTPAQRRAQLRKPPRQDAGDRAEACTGTFPPAHNNGELVGSGRWL